MKLLFSNQVLTHILEQSLLLNCVCPSQLCKTILEQRALYAYQKNCLNDTETDQAVHRRIAETVQSTHALLEQCLHDILVLENWDLATYEMPAALYEKILGEPRQPF
jgi:hypothetical protein